MNRAQYTADLHFKQRCEFNLYRDIAESLFNMLRGREIDYERLKIHYEILNYLHLVGVMDLNEYDRLKELLDYTINFFKP